MKRLFVSLGAWMALACSGAAEAVAFTYSLPGGALTVQPTVLTEEYQASFAIPHSFIVEDVNVTLHGLDTGRSAELIFLLSYLPAGFDPFNPVAPRETTVVLLSQLSLASKGDVNNPPPKPFLSGDFTFDDEAALSVAALTPPTPEALALRFGGTFRPHLDPLSDLDSFSSASLGGITVAGGTFPTPAAAWLLTIRSLSSSIGTTVGRFDGVTLALTGTAAPVPEPETWGTMLLGLAGIGICVRRRRRDPPHRARAKALGDNAKCLFVVSQARAADAAIRLRAMAPMQPRPASISR